jgi:hypothetical protein
MNPCLIILEHNPSHNFKLTWRFIKFEWSDQAVLNASDEHFNSEIKINKKIYYYFCYRELDN